MRHSSICACGLTAINALIGSIGSLHRASTPRRRGGLALGVLGVLVGLGLEGGLSAATLTWSGSGTDDFLSTANNWVSGIAPIAGDTLDFGGTVRLSPTLDSNLSVAGVTFATGAGSFILGGLSQFAIGATGITNNSLNSQTINTPILLGAAQSWNAASGHLGFGGSIANGGYLLTLVGAQNTSLSSLLTGTGGLTVGVRKGQVGLVTLSGANTYSGATTLSRGTVVIANNLAFGTSAVELKGATISTSGGDAIISNTLTLGASTTFSAPNNLTFTGASILTGNRTITVNGTGVIALGGAINSPRGLRRLTKIGAGTLSLGAANVFGDFTLTAGTVVFGNDQASGSGILSLGTATVQGAGGTRTLGNALTLNGNTTFSGADSLIFSGAATLNASRTLTVSNNAVTLSGAIGELVAGSLFALTKSGAGMLTLGGGAANTFSGSTAVTDGTLVLSKSAGNAIASPTVTIGDAVGVTGSAITRLGASNQILDTANLTLDSDGTLDVGIFNDTVGAVTSLGGSILGSGRLGLGGNLTVTATASNTVGVSAGLGLNGTRTFTVNDNAVVGDIDLAVTGAVVDGSVASGLNKAGAGTLLLAGGNTYSGGTNINAGSVLLGSSSVGAPLTSGPLGTGAVNLGDTVGSLAAGLRFDTGSGRIVGNAITARAGGMGLLTLGGGNASGINTFSGPIVLNRSISVSVAAGGQVDFTGVLSGSGALSKDGGGTMLLAAANSYTGLTTVNAGKLLYGISNALAAGAITLSGGTLDLGANQSDTVGTVILSVGGILGTGSSTLTSTAAFDLREGAVSARLAGANGIVKSTAGTVILSGLNAYTGTTSITAGKLQLGVSGALPSTSAVTISAAAILDLAGFSNTLASLAGSGDVSLGGGTLTNGLDNTSTAFSGAISGSGGITKVGTGTWTLLGSNSYSGSTLVSTGTLLAGGANTFSPFSDVNISLGGLLNLNNLIQSVGGIAGAGNVLLGTSTLTTTSGTSTTYQGVLSGNGSLIKGGTGTLTLAGANLLTGTVRIDSGTLTLSGLAGAITTVSAISVKPNAVLCLDNSGAENANRLGNSTGVNLLGGTLQFVSDANGTVESIGIVSAPSGASNISIGHNGTASDATTLMIAGLGTIGVGATVNFSSTGGILGSGITGPHIFITGQADGFLGGWATVGSNFAEYYQADGLRPFSQSYSGSDGINVNDATKIVQLTGTSLAPAYTLTNSGTTTDLGLTVSNLPTVDLGSDSSRTLNLASGGLIKSNALLTSISGLGRLTAANKSAGTLSVSVEFGATLNIASPILNNAGPDGIYATADDGVVSLSKSDAGLLILSGSSSYTGTNFLNAGTVRVSAEANLGNAANDIVFGGGTLNISSGFAANAGKSFLVSSDLTGTLEIDPGQTLTLANTSDALATGNTASVLLKKGLGTLVVPAANPGFVGVLAIQAGLVELRDSQGAGSGVTRGRIALQGGTLGLKNNLNTTFANDVSVLNDSTIDVARLTGISPAVAHSLGTLSIDAHTLTVTGQNGAGLAFQAVTLTGNAILNPTTAALTLGPISGAFGLTKTGPQSLFLSGLGTYSGATLVSGGTVTLGISDALPSTSAVTLNSGTVLNLNGYTTSIGSLSGPGVVQFAGGTLNVGGDNSSTTFAGNLSGSGTLSKSGTGVWTLSGGSSLVGPASITSGTLRVAVNNAISTSVALTISSGANFDLNGFTTSVGSLVGAGGLGLGTGTLIAGADNSDASFSGLLTGTGTLRKVGSGTWCLGVSNPFGGALEVQQGILLLNNAAALDGAGGGTASVTSGAELRLGAAFAVTAKPLTLAGAGTAGLGALRSTVGGTSWSGAITLSGHGTVGSDVGLFTLAGTLNNNAFTPTFTGAGDLEVQSVLSGAGGFIKSGAGRLTLPAANLFSGTAYVQTGEVYIQNATALGATGASNGTVVSSGAALVLRDAVGVATGSELLTLNGTGLGSAGALRNAAGNNSWAGDVSLASDALIAVDADSLTLSGVIGESGGSRALKKAGLGTLIFQGANTYTGATQVLAGVLATSASERIGNLSDVVLSSGAILDISDFDETIGSLAGAGSVSSGLNGISTLRVGLNGSDALFSGSISGSADLAKVGSGKLTVSGANTFTGDTLVQGGSLVLTGNLSATTSLAVTSGAKFVLAANDVLNNSAPITLAGGTLQTGGFSEGTASTAGLSVLTLSSNSVLDFAGSGNVLHFAASNSEIWVGSTLSIYNWDAGDKLFFGTSSSALTATQLARLTFFSDSGLSWLGVGQFVANTSEVTYNPVPEPSTWLAVGLGLGMLVFSQRCRAKARK